MNLGKTIKHIRKQKGITQSDISSNCNISMTYLSQIENNKKEPSINMLKNISDYLDIPVPVLFFLSMSEDDIQPNKKEAYKIIYPSIKNLLSHFIITE